ncbi:MAG TPA: chromosome segregation protein SMC [Thermoplasmata archaeon]|nr:chromosome segregation protein SMC [Thermoplasmata archaeon]
MHLKRLKVRNFKSFAGATEIPFEPGFTGVAGPNGMGKSNISDAILFVLGPTSSKALRAERLTHLFFNGGAEKKPASECEVSLLFDNRDRLLPVEHDEVELTRYVKLAPGVADGYYSYFYLNGRRSTQGEIDALLSHARLSGDGYNLVQQGDVNRIVSMGPVPRRGLVERLAGISQYDEELERAQSKQGELETNLGQVHALLGEIRTRIGALESQRVQAVQYKELQEEKRQAEGQLARAELLRARQEVNSCEAARDRLHEELEELGASTGGLESQRETLSAAIDQAEQEIAARAGPDGLQFKNEVDAARLAFARLDEQLRTAQESLEELAGRFTQLEHDRGESDKEVARLAQEEAGLSEKLTGVEERVKEGERALRSATGDAEHSQGKLVDLRRGILEKERLQQSKVKHWESAVQSVEAAKAAVGSAEKETALAEEEERNRELELKDLELRIREARGGPGGRGGERPSTELQQELFSRRNQEKSLQDTCQRLSTELLELNRRYTALDARLKVRADAGGRSASLAAVDYLLSLRNLGKLPGIRGTVDELARFDPPHRTALTVAAGNRFQALVVESAQVAEECIKLLRNEKRGRATFLPLDKMLPGRPKGKALLAAQSAGAVGFALDLVHFDEELRPAFWYVFGETVVMKELSAAREQMGGVRLVTLAGDLIEATGAITGGYLETGDRGRGQDNALELKRLGEELAAKSGEEVSARKSLGELQDAVRALSEELAKRSGVAQAQGSALQMLEAQLPPAREKVAHARRRAAEAVRARESADAELVRAGGALTELESAKRALEQELATLNEQYMNRLPGAVSGRIRTLQESQASATQEQLTLSTARESARANLANARRSLEELDEQLTTARSDRTRREAELKALQAKQASSRTELDKLKLVEEERLKAASGLTEHKRKLEAERLALVDKLARAQETLRTRRLMEQNEEVRLATAEKHLAELEAAAKELGEVEEGSGPSPPPEELRRKIQVLASQLDSMGSVNLRALEEYDAEKSRLDQFEGEVNRITSEKQDLHNLVGELEQRKREKLTKVVTGVDAHYRTIYSELSGGGTGRIALENPSDPLAGGLLIEASPVGKTVTRLEQLSGGEKSLASLAFVFALQRYDPSPLYVFDEVDMSLDGVNAENVGRMLRHNSERAQFIVISLRKVTLKFAKTLFGVTMHGDGRSRVVGIRLDEIVDVDERSAHEPPTLLAPGAAA